MGIIVKNISIVFVYMAVGFAANKLKILPKESNKYLIALLVNIALPCMMVTSITDQELRNGMLGNTIVAFAFPFLLFGILIVATLLTAHKLHLDYANELSVAMTAPNSGFMGFPITYAVFGNTVFYYLVLGNVAFNIYLYVMALGQLNYRGKNKSADKPRKSFWQTIKPFFNIVTIAPVIAVILLFAGIKIPAYPLEIATTIGDITIPLSMIVVGIQLGESNIAGVIKNKSLLITSLMKLIVVPLICLIVILPFKFDNNVALATVICMIFPTAVMTVAIAEHENKNSQIMAEAVAMSTLLSIATLPIWLLVLNKIFL